MLGLPVDDLERSDDAVVVREDVIERVLVLLAVCVGVLSMLLVTSGLELAVLEASAVIVSMGVNGPVYVINGLTVATAVYWGLRLLCVVRVDVLEDVVLNVIIIPF
jgi:hypothetical protein